MRSESIETLRTLMKRALALRKIDETDADLIVEDHLGAQIEGRLTHGLGKFLLLDAALYEREGAPHVVKRTPSCALVDGRKELGQIAARFCIDLLSDMAHKNGIAMVGMFNASRYGRLTVYGKMLAREDLVGIVMNNGGPAAVVPYNGIDPILGTNPICLSFPYETEGVAFDFSTSEKVWGEIRQAVLEGRELPEGAFLDKDGNPTKNPNAAEAVLPFNGPKGYALCLAIEILTGALVSAKMGLQTKNQYDLGFLFIAIDPVVFRPLNAFQADLTSLFDSIHDSRPRFESQKPRLPGEGSSRERERVHGTGQVRIDDETFRVLEKMSRSLNTGIESSNKMN